MALPQPKFKIIAQDDFDASRTTAPYDQKNALDVLNTGDVPVLTDIGGGTRAWVLSTAGPLKTAVSTNAAYTTDCNPGTGTGDKGVLMVVRGAYLTPSVSSTNYPRIGWLNTSDEGIRYTRNGSNLTAFKADWKSSDTGTTGPLLGTGLKTAVMRFEPNRALDGWDVLSLWFEGGSGDAPDFTTNFPANHTGSIMSKLVFSLYDPVGAVSYGISHWIAWRPEIANGSDNYITVDFPDSLCRAMATDLVSAIATDVTAPTITGPTGLAGDPTVTVSILENTTAVGTWTASESVTWTKSGSDSSLVAINGAGVCTLVSPLNYESPADAGANNTLNFTVTATDTSGNVSNQAVVLNITNANEVPTFNGPTITIPDGVSGTNITPIDVSSRFSDPDTGETIVYTKGGSWPVGVNLSAGGVISGSYPAVGTTSGLTVVATSSATLSVQSNTFSLTATMDSTGPTLTGEIDFRNVTTVGYDFDWPVATDNVGVVGYDYSLDGGVNWNSVGLVNTQNVTGRTPGSTDPVRVRARDAAGYFSSPVLAKSVSLPASADVTVPVLSGTITLGAVGNGAYSATCPVATDNVGVVSYDYQINGGSWATIANGGRTANVSARPAGIDTIAFRARDAAGNSSAPLSRTVNVPGPTTYGFTSEILYYTTGAPVPQAFKEVEYTIFIGSVTGSLNASFMYQGSGVTNAQGRLAISGLSFAGAGELWMKDEDGGRYFQNITVL